MYFVINIVCLKEKNMPYPYTIILLRILYKSKYTHVNINVCCLYESSIKVLRMCIFPTRCNEIFCFRGIFLTLN